MDAATLPKPACSAKSNHAGRVTASEFRDLLVSHRRMIRVDRRQDKLRGLQDLNTGELFFTDEHRLLDVRRDRLGV